jgi:hypothetical protein
VTADRVVLELARVAFGDPRRVMSWGPGGVRLRPSAELADEEAAIVAEVGETTTKEGGSLRVKTVDKLGALRLLGQHLGMFGERADAGAVAGAPEPGPLETVADVRREAAELYRRACRGEVSAGGASRLAGLLTLSARDRGRRARGQAGRVREAAGGHAMTAGWKRRLERAAGPTLPEGMGWRPLDAERAGGP